MRGTAEWTLDASLDRYARLVRRTVGAPVAVVTIVEADRQVFAGALGLPEPYQSTRQTPLSHSFCQYVVADQAPLVIADARADLRLHDNLAIPDLNVIAYAGWPLLDAAGEVVGSVGAIHGEAHLWSDSELDNLADLAAACSAELAQRELAAELGSTVAALGVTVAALERSNERLAAFAGQVSHDLRNPLAVMASSLELLEALREDVSADKDASEAFLVARATRSTRRMAALVEEVLGFAQVGGDLHRTTVDPAALVAGICEDLGLDPSRAGISVGPLGSVDADPVQLRVVLQNLLANAVKHAPGSPVEVRATELDGRWRLEVVDHGPGIALADRDRVLDSFVRLDPDVPGSGLGLATCVRIARAHGGDLQVHETPGGGVTIRLSLPSTQPAETHAPAC